MVQYLLNEQRAKYMTKLMWNTIYEHEESCSLCTRCDDAKRDVLNSLF